MLRTVTRLSKIVNRVFNWEFKLTRDQSEQLLWTAYKLYYKWHAPKTGRVSCFTKPEFSWIVWILGKLSRKYQVFGNYLEIKPNKSGALLGHPFGCWEKMIAVLVNTPLKYLHSLAFKKTDCMLALTYIGEFHPFKFWLVHCNKTC